MKFHPLTLPGAYLIEPEKRGDDRGYFARIFCKGEFSTYGLAEEFVQMSESFNSKRGTLRGLHYQLPPAAEVKVIKCVRGAIWDVIVDLRPNSPTYLKWDSAELNPENGLMMYAPRGFAHGFLTLKDDSHGIYLTSTAYSPDHERGLRFDDLTISIEWPTLPEVLSDKDKEWPDFDIGFHEVGKLEEFV